MSDMIYLTSSLESLVTPGAPSETYLVFPTDATYDINNVRSGIHVTVIDEEKRLKATGVIFTISGDGKEFTVKLQQSELRSLEVAKSKRRHGIESNSPLLNITLSLLISLSVIGYFMWDGVKVMSYAVTYADSWRDSWEITIIPWALVIAPIFAGLAANYAFRTRMGLKSAWFSTFFAAASGAIGGVIFVLLALSSLSSANIVDSPLSGDVSLVNWENIGRMLTSGIVVTTLLGASIPTYIALRRVPTTEYLSRI